MFFNKKKKENVYFVFNFGCSDPQKCIALSAENDVMNAEWYDKDGKHSCNDVPVGEDFWAELHEALEENSVFEWKAYKLCNHFATVSALEVFNAEGNFPNGKSFEANNMRGLPEGFEEATAAILTVFGNYSR